MKSSHLIAALLTLLIGHAIAGERPNIVFVLADDMGYADAGFNGGREIRTPNLDKVARSGAILTAHYVQPLCSPTRAALMTGRYPNRTGVYSVIRPKAPWGLKLNERTLADALRGAGYRTAICGKWHLGEFEEAYRPTRRGFDHQYGLWYGNIDYFTHRRDTGEAGGDSSGKGELDWHRDDQRCDDEGYATHLIAKEACRIIRDKDPASPLFLYLPFNAVHGPYQVPETYLGPYSSLKGIRRTYAGMLSAMDEAFGQVIAALEVKGLRDNTLIIFSSDNGGPSPGRITDNGPLRGGKGSLFEGGVRACAFASWPGRIPAGVTIDEPIHAVDWYPTLLKLAGASGEQKLPIDGLDILPVLAAGAKSPHEFLILNGTRRGQAAIRKGEWKLIVEAGGGEQLCNLAEDRGESTDLAAANEEKRRELRAIYDAMMESAVPSGEPPSPGVQRRRAQP